MDLDAAGIQLTDVLVYKQALSSCMNVIVGGMKSSRASLASGLSLPFPLPKAPIPVCSIKAILD